MITEPILLAAANKAYGLVGNVNVPDQAGAFVGFLGSIEPVVNSSLQVVVATNNGADMGGGNAANSLVVSVAYYVLNTQSGLFV